MKKFAVLLILAAVFAFAGCQGDSSENETEQTAETPKVPETVYYTVNFESSGENTIESQTVESGKTATEPSKPTKTGYTFSAWYEGENAFDFSTPIMKDTTLTAKWTANTYTVTLSNNGEESQVSVTFGENIGDLESVPSMANSSFGGFYTEEYAKGEKFIGADGKGCKAYEIASDTTLYAAWGYRISYENLRERENPNPEIYTGEEDVALLDLEGITGFAFAGWYDAETDGNKVETIAKGESGAKTLYARWSEVSYTVKHFLQNVDDDEYTEAENEKETFPGKIGDSTEAAAKTFTGFTAKTIEQKTIEIEETVVNVYYDRNLYEVTFNAKGGTPVASTQIRYGAKPTEPTTTRFPYDFLGWYSSSDEGETLAETAFDFDSETFSNLTLYAKWYLDISNCTADDAAEKIRELKESGSVVIKGEISDSTIKAIAKAISEKDSTIKIALDLSDTTGLTCIVDSAFKGCSSLTSIEIPSSVTSIESYAFSGCSSLTTLEIPSGVTSIESYAFSGCSSLTTLEIPSGVTSIESYAFSGCSSLTSIEIPSGVSYIRKYAFYDCSSLTSIEIPSSVTSIGESAFSDCSSLTSIEIPSSVTYIGDSTFSRCSSLTSIEIPSSVSSIGEYEFYRCSSLTNIEIPNSVSSIGGSAFKGCSSLTSIEIPSGVSYIREYAFYGCSSLTSIEIPNSVTSIREYAFYGCSSLTSIEIPNSETSIREYAFYGCSSLTSIEIPSSVTSIGEFAFYDCSSLTTLEIPSGVTSIGDFAFYDCSSLTSIEIPSNVTSIGGSAFYDCSSLTSIEIPNSVTSIGGAAFCGCSSLTSMTFLGTMSEWNNIRKRVSWNKSVPATEVVCSDGTVPLE